MNGYEKIDAYVLQLVERSTPERTAWNLEKLREGKPASWNYIDGCMLTALMEMERLTGDSRYFTFVKSCIDHFVGEDGSIRTFKPEAHNLDDINEGRVLFALYDRTGEEKYRAAADFLRRCLDAQPRTAEGNFWHKAIYPNQVWLDGVYMAQPFSALYGTHFGDGDCADCVAQIQNVRAKMHDAGTLVCRGSGRPAGDPARGGGPGQPGAHLHRADGVRRPLCRCRDGDVLAGTGPGRQGRKLPGDQRQCHAVLRHAQGRPAGRAG